MSEVPLYMNRARPVLTAHQKGSFVGPAVPSFRALSGRLRFTARRHKFNKYSLYLYHETLLARNGAFGILTCDLAWSRKGVFRGGLAFKAHRRFYHSTPGFRVIEKKKKKGCRCQRGSGLTPAEGSAPLHAAHPHTRRLLTLIGEVPRGEKMLFSGTDLESYITEDTLVYEKQK